MQLRPLRQHVAGGDDAIVGLRAAPDAAVRQQRSRAHSASTAERLTPEQQPQRLRAATRRRWRSVMQLENEQCRECAPSDRSGPEPPVAR
jgi:hypothetical protein